MSPIEFRDAERAATQLLILLAGGTGSGKTESALRLATGIAGGGTIVGIDTERGRMLHKADDYTFKHAELEPPFTPEAYVEAIEAAEKLNPAVIVIDSGSHEWDGDGGVLDLQEAELERLGNRDEVRMLSWKEPKRRHKRYRNALLRARPHVIVCHRAEDKIEMVKEGGRTVVRAKDSLTGKLGWIPIAERRLPFEATISLVLTPDNPGVPLPVKLERRHLALVPLEQQLDEATGARLAEWAAGRAGTVQGPPSPGEPLANRQADTGGVGELDTEIDALLELAGERGAGIRQQTTDVIEKRRGKGLLDAEWLGRLRASLEAITPEPADDPPADDDPETLFKQPTGPRGGAYSERG